MATFLNAVNKVLVSDATIAGDDDEISSFSSAQHVAAIRLAKIAINTELISLAADRMIPYEKKDAVLTVSARTATLASDFVRFQDPQPWLLEVNALGVSQGTYIMEFPGGEGMLRKTDLNYRETTGRPTAWYWSGGTTKTIGFWNVPSSTYYYRYHYEGGVYLSVETDTVPLVTSEEFEIFCQCATRRYKYMKANPAYREQQWPKGLEHDPAILEWRGVMRQLMRHAPAEEEYGRDFE